MKSLLIVLLLLASSVSYARSPMYLKLGLGSSITGSSELEHSGSAIFPEYDHEFKFATPIVFAFGSYFKESMAYEVEIGFAKSDLESQFEEINFRGTQLGLSIVKNFQPNDDLQPFVSAGFSLGSMKLQKSGFKTDNESYTGFKLSSGIDFMVSHQSSYGFELRYLKSINGPEYKGSSLIGGGSIEQDFSELQLIIVYKIGG